MNFLTGLTNLTNWLGNVIMPTLAGVFFVIVVILTLINVQLSKRWVHYEGEAP